MLYPLVNIQITSDNYGNSPSLPIVTQEMVNPTEWGIDWNPIEAGRNSHFCSHVM